VWAVIVLLFIKFPFRKNKKQQQSKQRQIIYTKEVKEKAKVEEIGQKEDEIKKDKGLLDEIKNIIDITTKEEF
jgi:translation initiation factor IF-3